MAPINDVSVDITAMTITIIASIFADKRYRYTIIDIIIIILHILSSFLFRTSLVHRVHIYWNDDFKISLKVHNA
jgi:hypothetical protein